MYYNLANHSGSWTWLICVFLGVGIVFAQLNASQIHAKKDLHELDFSFLWKKEIVVSS